MKNKKAAVAGHICLDITPVFPLNNEGNLANLLAPGKLVNVEQADIHTGGSVANVGLAMKRFGVDVKLIGKVGEDHFGELVLNILNKYGASEGTIFAPNTSTSYSIVIASPGVDRIFLHNPGANDTFRSEDITDDMLHDVSLFHFGYPTLMRNMYLHEGKELLKLLKKVKGKNIATSLDMAAIDPLSEAGKADWNKILRKIIPFVDFFVPSIEELGFMLDRNKYETWLKRAEGKEITSILSINDDIKPLADRLMDMGAKFVLIKCGASGMYYRTAGKSLFNGLGSKLELNVESWMNKEGFEKSYEPDRVLSATGAGDTSIAAFLTSILEGYSLEQCLQFATATGACCVSEYDALSGLKPFKELKRMINDGWDKQNILVND
ncbi:carbohydrate kinase family protein [Litchfieldia alkalitelluris]|uniref:carbohydrate kinase family protein n=1 Tax=Litchfieldia alkalitelluris TaxID=304268 RepID=UPI00099891A2|nr:carbohydrate kinase family protein [Litchfieldia alkalitelluris]